MVQNWEAQEKQSRSTNAGGGMKGKGRGGGPRCRSGWYNTKFDTEVLIRKSCGVNVLAAMREICVDCCTPEPNVS